MNEERLIKYLASRKSWMPYTGIAKYFNVTPETVQSIIKKLEKKGIVEFKFGEHNKKLWQLSQQKTPPIKRPPPIIIHRISDGDERTTPKPQNKRPVSPQTWFSVLGIKDRAP